MLGKEIYSLVYETLNKSLRMQDIDKILEYMPTSLDQVFAMPGYGFYSVTNQGPKIIEAIGKIKSIYNIKPFSLMEAHEVYQEYIQKIEALPTIYADSFGEFASAFNLQASNFGIPFELTAKKLLVYCKQKGLILYQNDAINGTPSVSELGEKFGFIIKTKSSIVGKEYSVVKLTRQSCEFLMHVLDDIFYTFYGFNKLNYYKLNPYRDFIFETNATAIKRKILIFDLDGTIFDTDFLRKKRRKNIGNINSKDYSRVKFIEGFEDAFLDSQSELYLKNYLVLFITASPSHYAYNLLSKLMAKIGSFNYKLESSCGHRKNEVIKDFLESNSASEMEVIAFGDDEKDALIYSMVGVPYYIVNNYYGYGLEKEILNNLIYPNANHFRNLFMYSIISADDSDYISGFLSDYIDDIVVYYRRYYDKTNIEGSCPEFEGRPQLPRLTHQEFGSNKSKYLFEHYNDFVNNDFNDFFVTKEVVFAKVPGHAELESNKDSPCRYLLDELSKRYGLEKNYHDLLLRLTPVEENHGKALSNRHIKRHLKSIYVNPKKKLKGKIVYLFDDVVTSGASMMACVELLYRKGAGHVVCFCLGRNCPRKYYPIKMIDGGEIY